METKFNIEPCPFCGGAAVLKRTEIFMRQASVIVCEKCGARSSQRVEGAALFNPQKHISIEDCDREAVERWNRRTYSGGGVLAA